MSHSTLSIIPATESSSSIGRFFDTVCTAKERISTLMKVRQTLDLKEVLTHSLQKGNDPFHLSLYHPTRNVYLTASSAIMRTLFSHHRNDPNGIFLCTDADPVLGLIQLFFPGQTLSVNDFILKCDPQHSKPYREILQHAFSNSSIDNHYSSSIKELVQTTLQRWSSHEGAINLSHELRLFASTIISKIVLGYKPHEKAPSIDEISEAVNGVSNLYLRKAYKLEIDQEQFLRMQRVMQEAIDHCYDCDSPFIKMLKESGMSELQAKVMICTLFIAGQETSSTVLAEAFWQLASNPALQNSTREKLEQAVTADCRKKIIDPVLVEALRLRPPAFGIARLARTNLTVQKTDAEGTKNLLDLVRKGDVFTACPFAAGRDAKIFPNPDLFDPSRNISKHQMGWFPFGSGPHRCPGRNLFWEEASELIASALQFYRLSTDQKQQPKSKGLMTDHFIEDLSVTVQKI